MLGMLIWLVADVRYVGLITELGMVIVDLLFDTIVVWVGLLRVD